MQDEQPKLISVEQYVAAVPAAAQQRFNELREIVLATIPEAREVVSYGILGYKFDDKRARVFISGFKDHVAIYPVPGDESLHAELAPHIHGKGTLWFALDTPLPRDLIVRTVESLRVR